MIIMIGDNGEVTLPCGDLLGCEGEHILRRHRVIHPKFGSAYYTMTFVYEDDTSEEAMVIDGELVMTEELLPAKGEVRLQFKATLVQDQLVSIFKSEVFKARIGESL